MKINTMTIIAVCLAILAWRMLPVWWLHTETMDVLKDIEKEK